MENELVKLEYGTPPPAAGPVTEADLGPTRTSIAVMGVMWFGFMALLAIVHMASAAEMSASWPWGRCVKLMGLGLLGLGATVIAFRTRPGRGERVHWVTESDRERNGVAQERSSD